MPAINPADYAFTAAVANARSADGRSFDERFVELDIREYDEKAAQAVSGVWVRMQGAIQKYHEQADEAGVAPGWAGWDVRRWCDSKAPANREKFVAWDGDVIAGFLTVRRDFSSPHNGGKRVLYLEHLGTAPGNLRTSIWCRRLKQVGPAMFAFAVMQSALRGYEGLLGLHAADDEAEAFYQKLNALCGGRLFRDNPAAGVAAPEPMGDRRAMDRPYYETTSEGAEALLLRFRIPK